MFASDSLRGVGNAAFYEIYILSNVPALMIRDFAGKQTCSKLSVNAFNALSETG